MTVYACVSLALGLGALVQTAADRFGRLLLALIVVLGAALVARAVLGG